MKILRNLYVFGCRSEKYMALKMFMFKEVVGDLIRGDQISHGGGWRCSRSWPEISPELAGNLTGDGGWWREKWWKRKIR